MSERGHGRRHKSATVEGRLKPDVVIDSNFESLESELAEMWRNLQGEGPEYLSDLRAIQRKYRESLEAIANDPVTQEYRRNRDRQIETAP